MPIDYEADVETTQSHSMPIDYEAERPLNRTRDLSIVKPK
jgi:hypothetical protein